ncbi:TetR/AcrR family transcriptional regulator [Hyalangium rubrum]|uniref:TetR/AcrR family transcriptional regulator n=1 Tax=Hyalangium rubrum TaxID=3103134 RepID=A0ABU5GVF0_9BACT|nr:TetR/AcrR family transcriptional regulator [Hyalangium sp. s54d21]MDY7225150.1 TetR/AcrR family transcriptional regulator [Hyalangium sp. s54d21]
MSQQQSSKTAEAGAREGDRRRTILRAAIDVFARKGYHGCRIADVAKEAGVAYGLVYHYFKNKDELLETVFDACWSGFFTRVQAISEGEGTLAQKLQRITDVVFEAFRVDPRAVKVLVVEVARSPVGRVNRQTAFSDTLKLCSDMLVRAQAAGELREDVDPRLSAMLLFGTIEMGFTSLVMGVVDTKDSDKLEQAKQQIASSFLQGVLTQEAVSEVSWKKEREKSATRPKVAKRS